MVDTGDIDLLVDTRGGLRFVVSDEIAERSLLTVLRSVDKSFEKSAQPYRAQNSEGYMVDLIKPMRNPPWKVEASQIGNYNDDLTASETAGLVWLENAPAFEATVIDEKGYPLAIAAADPRVWAAHKLWFPGEPIASRSSGSVTNSRRSQPPPLSRPSSRIFPT